MVKKITKPKDGFTLEINKEVADALGIDKKSALEMILVDDMLIVKHKNKNAAEKRKTKTKEITKRLMKQYEPVLKKLAKT